MSAPDLPRLFLFGAPRCATSTLYAYLQPHPDIFFPSLKEPRFFSHAGKVPHFSGPGDADRVNHEASWVEAEYRALYADADEAAWSGDATTTYLADRNAGRRIKECVPEPRFIGLLRNPVERAFSCYSYKRGQGLEPAGDFETALAQEPERRANGWAPIWHYTELGFYARQIQAYFELFPAECFRFYTYETFTESPRVVLADIQNFLGLKQEFHQGSAQHHNPSKVPQRMRGPARLLRRLRRAVKAPDRSQRLQPVRADELSRETHERLTSLFSEDVKALEGLLHLDLSAWRTPIRSDLS